MNDPLFNEKNLQKKEFNIFEIYKESLGLQDKCKNNNFEIAPHQIVS